MSYSSRSPPLDNRRQSAPAAPQGRTTAPARDRSGSYVEDSKLIGDAVKRIQEHAADISREARVLGTAQVYTGSKQKVHDATHAAKTSIREAKQLLERFPTSGGGSVSEQNHRRLIQQKLTKALIDAINTFEEAFRSYERAEAAHKQRRESSATAASAAEVPRRTPGLELGSMPGGARQLLVTEVTEAEVDTHTAIVEETAEDIASISRDIVSLQQVMVDMAGHVQQQGTSLDTIEANMNSSARSTEVAGAQLVHASRHQRTGNKVVFCLLGLVVLVAVALITVVVVKSKE